MNTQTDKEISARRGLIARLFPEELPTPEDLEKHYPPRKLPDDAMVTRIAPSPTGPMHVGSLYTALISERLAHQSGGVFYLRNEDTDKLREVPGAAEFVVHSLHEYHIPVDEGQTTTGKERGNYGPYKQSEREKIYKTYIKKLLEEGKAYPCFATAEELERMHSDQESAGIRPGYYGKWALWRDRPLEEVEKALDEKKPYVIRFRSEGNFDIQKPMHDILKGDLMLSLNDQDIVILKSDGRLPTYHLGHVVDDHLMGTTHVLRADEWLSSTMLHQELFHALGFEPPKYGHLAPIQKIDGVNAQGDPQKRKLSKRKDPEASVAFFGEAGYPAESIIDYLLNLASSDFEQWRKENPDADSHKFPLKLEKLAKSNGPLFDFVKLADISKNTISRFSAEEIYRRGLEWAKKYAPEFSEQMAKYPQYTKAICNIERIGEKNVRKDIAKWSDLQMEFSYFYDELFQLPKKIEGVNAEDIAPSVNTFLETYDEDDAKEVWFGKIKHIAASLGYAESTKQFKAEPEKYKGQVSDIAKIFRVILTGKINTPDLYSIMKVMGHERLEKRLLEFIASLQK